MSQETEVLLRTILYQAKISKSAEEIINAIEVMCTKDTIAAVNEKAEIYKKKQEAKEK